MKIYTIVVRGNSISEIVAGIDEAKKGIVDGNLSGIAGGDSGEMSFDSSGEFEEEEEEEEEAF